jgi:Flp pilus assembly protein TadD
LHQRCTRPTPRRPVRRAIAPSIHDNDAIERARDLTLRAHRLRRKGELRRALVALREACGLDEQHAARWVWLSYVLRLLGKRDEAEQAMKQALYLRQRNGEKSKANVIRDLLFQLGRA